MEFLFIFKESATSTLTSTVERTSNISAMKALEYFNNAKWVNLSLGKHTSIGASHPTKRAKQSKRNPNSGMQATWNCCEFLNVDSWGSARLIPRPFKFWNCLRLLLRKKYIFFFEFISWRDWIWCLWHRMNSWCSWRAFPQSTGKSWLASSQILVC